MELATRGLAGLYLCDREAVAQYETPFLHEAGLVRGAVKHLTEDDKIHLTIDLISDEAITTSEIEGEILNRDSVQSSMRRNFGLETDNRKIPPAEQGIAAMMTDLLSLLRQAPIRTTTIRVA